MNEEIKIPIKKIIGQVIETENCYNKCSCGEVVVMEYLGSLRTGKIVKEIPIGICKCGNIFRTP